MGSSPSLHPSPPLEPCQGTSGVTAMWAQLASPWGGVHMGGLLCQSEPAKEVGAFQPGVSSVASSEVWMGEAL